jgi:hypothetical protein
MSEMVERVAKAICVSEGAVDPDGSFEGVAHWERYAAEARAAIEAMREPTEQQVAAGIVQARECTDNWTAAGSCVAEHVWAAMISAALSTPDRMGGEG